MYRLLALPLLLCSLTSLALGAEDRTRINEALQRAGKNRPQIERALKECAEDQREGMQFLVAYMPQRDLQTLSARFLLDNVTLSYQTWRKSAWGRRVPRDIFFNYVLPYCSINEHRDNWRKDFHARFRERVEGAQTASQATAILNRTIFNEFNVRFSTKRPKADQSPYETISAGMASCTGLSVLLIDACRAVGIPARFVGTPRWSDNSGNHSWVEIWDQGWHFTGAAEPAGEHLDRAWFTGRAATAKRDQRLHAIYAVSYKQTPLSFPLVWDAAIDYVYAVNVSDRYTQKSKQLPVGTIRVAFRVVDNQANQRLAADFTLRDISGKPVFKGTTKDERFDPNDHLTFPLKQGESYDVELNWSGHRLSKRIRATKDGVVYTFHRRDLQPAPKTP